MPGWRMAASLSRHDVSARREVPPVTEIRTGTVRIATDALVRSTTPSPSNS